jgi:Domain of Unknown Function (DUF1259)
VALSPDAPLSRRRALVLGGSLAGGVLGMPAAATAASRHSRLLHQSGHLPVKDIEKIIGIEGTVSSGILDISVAREDIGEVRGPEGVVFTPDFQVHGDLYFQPLGRGRAILNGDMALKPGEVNPFIRALLHHGLIFQAYHQHLIEMKPQVWFNHFRAVGGPLQLARAIRAAIEVTSTPLPQPPASTHTPLAPERLARILHGSATVANGVVTVSVPRTDRIVLGNVVMNTEAGLSTTVEFKPLGGERASVVPDFALSSREVMPVMRTMTRMGWFIGCLYNQETDEHPQLYFSHQLKSGNAYELAREVRRGLNHTASQ